MVFVTEGIFTTSIHMMLIAWVKVCFQRLLMIQNLKTSNRHELSANLFV